MSSLTVLRAAGGVVAPLPVEVSSLLDCRDSVTWGWLVCPPMCVMRTLHCVTGASYSMKPARLLGLVALSGMMLVLLLIAIAARMSLPMFALGLSRCALLAIVDLVANLSGVVRLLRTYQASGT